MQPLQEFYPKICTVTVAFHVPRCCLPNRGNMKVLGICMLQDTSTVGGAFSHAFRAYQL